LRALPQGLLVAVLRRFLKSPTAVHSGLNDSSPATAAELERLAEQLRAPAGAPQATQDGENLTTHTTASPAVLGPTSAGRKPIYQGLHPSVRPTAQPTREVGKGSLLPVA
jgi:hypothetical protein